MNTIDLCIQELEQKRASIDQALRGLNEIKGLFSALTSHESPPKTKRGGRPTGPPPRDRSLPCPKCGNAEYDNSNRCRPCMREYARIYNQKQRLALARQETPAATPMVETPMEKDRAFLYSKPCRCPKCGAGMVRLRRLAEADLSKDCWLHIHDNGQPPCTIKIAHYKLKDDPSFQPKETVLVS